MRLGGCRGSPCHTVSLSDGTPEQICVWLALIQRSLLDWGLQSTYTVPQLKGDSMSPVTEHLQNSARHPNPTAFWNWDQGFPVCCIWPTLLRWMQVWLTSLFWAHGTGVSLLVAKASTDPFTAWNQQPVHPCLLHSLLQGQSTAVALADFSPLSSLEWSFQDTGRDS